MVPCELKPGGILREMGIFGPKIERPLFEVIQFLPTESLTKDFWVNRLKTIHLNRLIKIDIRNGNDHSVLFTILVVLIHFPETFFDFTGVDLSKMYDNHHHEISPRTKMILVSIWYVQSKSERCVLSEITQEILQMERRDPIFEKDRRTENRINTIRDHILVTV
jgi:hypothetical protein